MNPTPSESSLSAPHHSGDENFHLRFTFRAALTWVLRYLSRALRGQHTRFYIRSPSYSPVQTVVDTERGDSIQIRVRDSIDIEVIKQIFVAEDYRLRRLKRYPEIRAYADLLMQNMKMPLILDLGANTGLASVYFAREFPTASVIAVEPDAGNAAAARRNLAQFPSVTLVQAGISCADGKADMLNPGNGNWSYRTEISESGAVKMVSIPSLLATHAKADIAPLIIKVDIEGFESDLFSKNTAWIDAFPILIIELHDWMLPRSANSGNFLREISKRNRDFIYIGENVFSISNESWQISSETKSLF